MSQQKHEKMICASFQARRSPPFAIFESESLEMPEGGLCDPNIAQIIPYIVSDPIVQTDTRVLLFDKI